MENPTPVCRCAFSNCLQSLRCNDPPIHVAELAGISKENVNFRKYSSHDAGQQQCHHKYNYVITIITIIFNTLRHCCRDAGDGLMHVGRVTVTPTRVVRLPFEVETSNRVLRKYHAEADRFIRVTFADEEGNRITYPGAAAKLEAFYLR